MTKILTIIPYTFYPPINGGSLRCFHLLKEMAKKHDVCILTVQPNEDFDKKENPLFPYSVQIFSSAKERPSQTFINILPSKFANAINYRFMRKKLMGRTNGYFLHTYRVLLNALQEIKPDIVYYESLETVVFFSDIVRKKLPKAKQLYDAHNIDSLLWKQLAVAQQRKEFEKYEANALKSEKKLFKYVDAVFCCSEIDEERLQELNNNKLKSWVIPNGVDTGAKVFDESPNKYLNNEILFCGNLDYFPNEEGLMWFYKKIFPLIKAKMPTIKLSIVGTSKLNKNYKILSSDPSILFEGIVSDVRPFYHRASICIAPLLTGSGTRLKILEALSFGNPIVSTTTAVEGINVFADVHIYLADHANDFVVKILQLLESKILFDNIRNNGRNLVSSLYDWQFIGSKVSDGLNILIS